jgi:hypothetical protein
MKKPTTEEEMKKLVTHTTGYMLLLNCVIKYGQDYIDGTRVYSQRVKQLMGNLKREVEDRNREWVDALAKNEEDKVKESDLLLVSVTVEEFYAKIDQILGDDQLLVDFIEGEIAVTEENKNRKQWQALKQYLTTRGASSCKNSSQTTNLKTSMNGLRTMKTARRFR